MTDKELLERAAKAAGLWDEKNGCIDIPWSPLTDDADAFWLAVKLNIHIEFNKANGLKSADRVQACPMGFGHLAWVELFGSDPSTAARRAIVRAAAALAKE